jgi:N6-L-threonylcarbamoyladenine synthase
VDTLVDRARDAVDGRRTLLAVGGVSLNRRLRAKLATMAQQAGIRLVLAAPEYCTDNAAMVAGLAAFRLSSRCPSPAMDLDAEPNLELGVAPDVQ